MAFSYAQMREEYAQLWSTMQIKTASSGIATRIAESSIAARARYRIVENRTGVPWYWIAAAHSLEASQNFKCHLHNGDPLSARTVRVPANRPKNGSPPFDWTESAVDALTMSPHELHKVQDWTIERCLYELERYNGWGYRLFHPGTLSPYLWSFSNHYLAGKYIADGKWSSTHASTQCGAAPILKKIFELDAETSGKVGTVTEKVFDTDTENLQEYLNALGADPKLAVDGIYGAKTRQAVKDFQVKANLSIDGIAGPKTFAAIKLRLSA